MIERTLRGIAGAFLIISVGLAFFFGPVWLWLILFIGFNLFQSAFTNWCPMMWILQKMGMK
jgi:hypothetical protein